MINMNEKKEKWECKSLWFGIMGRVRKIYNSSKITAWEKHPKELDVFSSLWGKDTRHLS